MRGIARGLDGDRLPRQASRQRALGLKAVKHLVEESGETGVEAQFKFTGNGDEARL